MTVVEEAETHQFNSPYLTQKGLMGFATSQPRIPDLEKKKEAAKAANSKLFNEKVTFEELKKHLWAAADILRGSVEPSVYRQPVMTLLFLKRLNDTFEENAEKLEQKGKNKKEAWENRLRHSFFVPATARWSVLAGAAENIGEKIDHVCRVIEKENPKLDGVLTTTIYNDKKKFPDNKLRALVAHFNEKRLRNSDLEKEDVFGDAYEYLLEQFAEETKKDKGQFFTPREVVRLLVNVIEPKAGMTINDPTCGSGGMLIESTKYVARSGGDPENLVLEGQDSEYSTVAMCKMNMVLHNIVDFDVQHADVLAEPKFVVGGKLKKYDRVIANFPFSMDWENAAAAKDPYGRFRYGIPPSKDKADFAFIQHMLASLNENGRAAIICSQGILFRGGEEEEIRKNMILGDPLKGLQGDVIEGIVALPEKLFYGTGIPGCVLLLNRNKPTSRKNKIILIHGAKEYDEGKNRNKLRPQDIDKVARAFRDFKDIDRYCHIAELDELKENEYNLNVPRYVDISEPEEVVDIQKTIEELKKLDKEKVELEVQLSSSLQELGFKV